ncbi:MAG TPA: response regulator transcription factor [Sedimentibacter sp.]|jgi:DNA-binding response OmpR family regulator|nr:DNA-binding response regulator [Clostridiales bacterium]HOT21516.1 response regulator transcription factor [Sedimentibacter sp.]HPB80252.1 response regulator transcription factor [Sedimentibacter sp.]HQC69459.1 response regulator transcription factor [Sedimentibacter sp.]HQK54545.1 response regulator transcription factor [Sedimentibacter sp.]
MKEKILVVDDEENLLNVIKDYLLRESYEVYTANRGNKAIELFRKIEPDFIILDLMLPDISGEEICKLIRKESNVPILMLTAKSSEDDKVTGLYIGADDYLTKPFSPRELVGRVRAILRRTKGTAADVLEFNDKDLYIDIPKHIVKKAGESIKLTPNEFKILSVLAQNPHKVFTRSHLVSLAFGYDFEGFDRTVDTHIKNLRQKIEDNVKEPKYIVTVYGVGYKFEGV